jgi:hypothetical protein
MNLDLLQPELFPVNSQHEIEEIPTDLWQTPPDLLGQVCDFLGDAIDLDVCTALDNPTKAERFLTLRENALLRSWDAITPRNIWCNWPYSANALWLNKLRSEAQFTKWVDRPIIGLGPMVCLSNKSTAPSLQNCDLIIPLGRIKFFAPPALQEYRIANGLPPQPKSPDQNANVALYCWGLQGKHMARARSVFADKLILRV